MVPATIPIPIFGRWTPARLSPRAWYTASPTYCFTDLAGTTPGADGSRIRLARDRSGNGYDATQAGNNPRPVLSLSGGSWELVFDADDFLDVAVPVATDWTLSFSARGYGMVCGGTDGVTTSEYVWLRNSPSVEAYFDNGFPSHTIADPAMLSVITLDVSGTSHRAYQNNVSVGSGSYGGGFGPTWIGKYVAGLFLAGAIRDLVLVPSRLSDADRALLVTYQMAV